MTASLLSHAVRTGLGTILLLAATVTSAAGIELSSKISTALQSDTPLFDGLTVRHRTRLDAIYERRDYRPIWMRDGQFSSTANAVVQKFDNSFVEGLIPSKYLPDAVSSWSTSPLLDDRLKAELLLTDSLIEFFHDVALGSVSSPGKKAGWHFPAAKIDVNELTDAFFLGAQTFRESLEALRPAHKQYHRLLAQMTLYHRISVAGGWGTIDDGPTLRRNDRDLRIVQLKNRLRASGDLQSDNADPLFDSITTSALISFQRRHGLEVDGLLGKSTLQALNVSVEERIEQIAINMERWRWLPRDHGDSHIMVNVAGSELELIVDNEPSLDMRVVVGKPDNPTPLFSDKMEYLVFNPAWHVPSSITRKLLRKELANPGYLQARNYSAIEHNSSSSVSINALSDAELQASDFLSTYRLRQAPGRNNTLGKVKFMFPNRFSVYLHDTRERKHFANNYRAYSHGCVRVEEPDMLARQLLQSDVYSENNVDKVLQSNRTQTRSLEQPVPVHLTYQTSWVDRFGTLQFRPDIYRRDNNVQRRMKAKQDYYVNRERSLLQPTTSLTLASSDQ